MVNFFNKCIAFLCILAITLNSSFLIASNTGTAKFVPYNYNHMMLANIVEKNAEKTKKCLKKNDLEGCLKYLYKIKSDVEFLTEIEIDLEGALKNVFRQLNARGVGLHKSEMEFINDYITKSIKKSKSHEKYKSECLLYGLKYDAFEASVKYGNQTHAPKPTYRLMVGVTATLCGMFILMIPFDIPAKHSIAAFLIFNGLQYCVDEITEVLDKQRPPASKEEIDEYLLYW